MWIDGGAVMVHLLTSPTKGQGNFGKNTCNNSSLIRAPLLFGTIIINMNPLITEAQSAQLTTLQSRFKNMGQWMNLKLFRLY